MYKTGNGHAKITTSHENAIEMAQYVFVE